MMVEYIVMVDDQRKPTDHPNDPLPWLLGLPALEEIIRCRDCAHSDTEDGMMFCRIASTGQWKYAPVDSDGFCAWAERRDA